MTNSKVVEDLSRMVVDVIAQTGRHDLVDRVHEHETFAKSLLEIADEAPGVDRVLLAIAADAAAVEQEIRPTAAQLQLRAQADLYRSQASAYDAQGELMKVEHQLTRLGLRKRAAETDADFEGTRRLLEAVAHSYHDSVLTLLKRIQNVPRRVRRTTTLVRIIPTTSYLLASLTIFGIGASVATGPISDIVLNLVAAVAIWALQEVAVAPAAMRAADRWRVRRVRGLVLKYALEKTFLFATIASLGHQLDGHTSKIPVTEDPGGDLPEASSTGN